jgi:transcriptional/translational regulatory protein YebC/TACO1
MGAQGSVMYQFERKGVITVEKEGKSLDDIFLIAADSFAEDVEDAGEEALIYTKPEDLAKARDGLLSQNMKIKAADLIYRPIVNNAITDREAAEKALAFMEKLEDLNDVQKVYANFDIPDDVMRE